MIRENLRTVQSGIAMLLGCSIGLLAGVGIVILGGNLKIPALIVLGIILLLGSAFLLIGLFAVAPNDARVLQLFGAYVGTVRDPGLKWANPFYTKHKVSVKIRNFESSKLKVNDSDGSPIEIGAVVVWRVVDTAEAVFEVDDYENYVKVQSEAALRNLATRYPYDSHDDITHAPGDPKVELAKSLRGSTSFIANELKSEVQERLAKAGVEVMEARISHLAYAPEIASSMLRRQQASAIIAARSKIVEGAVSMVEMALDQLQKKQVVELDNDRKAAMVSNLLVVLCGDSEAQPVVNTGTIHQ